MIFLLFLMAVIFFGIILLSFTRTNDLSKTVRLSPTPTPRLSKNEQVYPEATTQPYYSDGSGLTGTLIVTSIEPAVRVRIDDGEEEGPVEPAGYPIQRTPFKITKMPAGKHMLRAVKPGYLFEIITIEIQPGRIERVEIDLRKIQSIE